MESGEWTDDGDDSSNSSSPDASQLKQKLAQPKPQTALSDYRALYISFYSFYLYERLRYCDGGKFKCYGRMTISFFSITSYCIALLSLDSLFALHLSNALTTLLLTDWNETIMIQS